MKQVVVIATVWSLLLIVFGILIFLLGLGRKRGRFMYCSAGVGVILYVIITLLLSIK